MNSCDRCGSMNCCQNEWREDVRVLETLLADQDAEIKRLNRMIESDGVLFPIPFYDIDDSEEGKAEVKAYLTEKYPDQEIK